jgi:hypothetical protein
MNLKLQLRELAARSERVVATPAVLEALRDVA